MVTIKINEEDLVDALVERVKYWTDDTDIIELYDRMYNSYVYGGCFDGAEIDIMNIVDNDYVNWCSILLRGDDGYEEIKAIYEEQGLGDCSCECQDYMCSYIEAEYNDMFLVRS